MNNNKNQKIKRRSQQYFRPDMNEKKICMFFRIEDETDQYLPSILNIENVQEFMKEKQVDSYPVNGLEFTFNVKVVEKEHIKSMLEVIDLFSHSLEDIQIKVTKSIAEEIDFEDLVKPIIHKPLSLTLDWKAITKVGNNERMLPFLELFSDVTKDQYIRKLNISFAQVKTQAEDISETFKFLTSLKRLEDLKISFTHYIRSIAFEPLTLATFEQKQFLKKVDFDFTNASLSENGSVTLSTFLKDCTNLESIKLNLRFNKLGDKELIMILNSIEDKEYIQNMHLALSSNCFKEEGSNYLVNFLNTCACVNQLKSLNLDLKLFELLNEEISISLFSMLNKLQHLKSLTLNFQRITIQNPKQCLQEFSLGLGSMTELEQLNIDLSWSNIKSEIISLFVQIGNLTQLTHLSLGLLGIPFGERKMKKLESGIQQLKSLQMLTLNLDLRNTYRGNHMIYQDLINIIERELTPLMNLQLPEIDQISTNYYIDLHQMYERVQQKILLRKHLVYSILLIKKLFMIGKIKRKEMINDFAQFLMQPKYFKSTTSFIPPAPEILDYLE